MDGAHVDIKLGLGRGEVFGFGLIGGEIIEFPFTLGIFPHSLPIASADGAVA